MFHLCLEVSVSRLMRSFAIAAATVFACSGCSMIGGGDDADAEGPQVPDFNVNATAYKESSGEDYLFSSPDGSITCAVQPVDNASELICNVPYAEPPFFGGTTAAQSVVNAGHGAGFVASTDNSSSAKNQARPLLAGNVITAYDFTCATPEDSVLECWHGDEHFRFAQGALESNDWTADNPRKEELPDGGLCGWTEVEGARLPIVVVANGLGKMECPVARDISNQVIAAGFDSDTKLASNYFGDMSCSSSDPKKSSSSAIVDCSYSGGNTDSSVGFKVYPVTPR